MLLHHHWLLLLDVDHLLLLDWVLLDVDIFLDVLVYDVALANNGLSITVSKIVLSSSYDTTVLFRLLLFLLKQFCLSLLFFAISFFLSSLLLSECLFFFVLFFEESLFLLSSQFLLFFSFDSIVLVLGKVLVGVLECSTLVHVSH